MELPSLPLPPQTADDVNGRFRPFFSLRCTFRRHARGGSFRSRPDQKRAGSIQSRLVGYGSRGACFSLVCVRVCFSSR